MTTTEEVTQDQRFTPDSVQPEMTLEEFENRQRERLDLLRKTTLVMGIAVVVLIAIAVAVFAGSMILTVNGVVTPQFNFHMLIISVFTLIIALTVFFSGLRPYKARLRDLEETLKELEITDDYAAIEYAFLKEDQLGRLEEERIREEEKEAGVASSLVSKSSSENMDDFFKIFERGIRNELVPPWESYRRVLAIRNVVFLASAIVLVVAVVVYVLFPAAEVASILLLLLFYLGIIVGFYIDRSQLKPERKKFSRMLNATEFEARYQMYRDNKIEL